MFTVEDLVRAQKQAEQSRRLDWRIAMLLALCLISAIVGRLCYIIRPFDSDGSMFIYMGRLISEGGRFCHDLVDNKFPSVGLITSVPWRLFGANWMCYVVLGALMSIGTTAMLVRAAGRTFGDHAKIPALLFSLVYLNFNFAVFGGFQLETIQALFTVIAASAALEWLEERDHRDAFVIGLASGLAMMCKPTGLAPLAAFALVAIVVDPGAAIRQSCTLLAGLLIPIGTVLVHLLRTDTLGDMPTLWAQIARYAANSSWDSSDWTKPITILILGGFPIFVRGVIFRRESDRLDGAQTGGLKSSALWFVIAWLTLECVGIAAQRRMYAYHFLVLAPPLTLVFAMIPRKLRAKSLAAALLPTALFSIYGGSLVLEICYTGKTRNEVSEYIAKRTEPSDVVWKDDAARLWLETGCRPATRFPMTFLFANYDDAPIEYVAQMLSDFQSTNPKYIVLPAQRQRWVAHQCKYILELSREPVRRENFEHAWNAIFAFVDRDYELEARIDQDAVYRRRVESLHAQPNVAKSD